MLAGRLAMHTGWRAVGLRTAPRHTQPHAGLLLLLQRGHLQVPLLAAVQQHLVVLVPLLLSS